MHTEGGKVKFGKIMASAQNDFRLGDKHIIRVASWTESGQNLLLFSSGQVLESREDAGGSERS